MEVCVGGDSHVRNSGNCLDVKVGDRSWCLAWWLRRLLPVVEFLDVVPALTPNSSFLLIWTLGGSGSLPNTWISATHVGELVKFLVLALTQPWLL